MVFINQIGIVIVASILCATMCTGKNVYDEVDEGGTELKRAFYAGSRYGRSQYGTGTSSNLRVAPRRDFHFLRYGKRGNELNENKSTIQCYEDERDYILTCSFTGVQDYYRCWKGQENKFDVLDKVSPSTSDNSNSLP